MKNPTRRVATAAVPHIAARARTCNPHECSMPMYFTRPLHERGKWGNNGVDHHAMRSVRLGGLTLNCPFIFRV